MSDRMAAVRALVAPLLAALSLQCAAAPFAVRLGEVSVVLDAPPGFADTLELASPRLQELAEGLTSASNRILLFALTDADLRRFMVGDAPELRRYLLVATPRALERESIGLSQFRAQAEEALSGLGEPAAPADLRAFLDAQPVGKPRLLAQLRRTPVMASLLTGTRLPPREGKPQYLLTTTTLLLLRGKQLVATAYAGYGEDLDAAWLRDLTQRWIDELQRLNGR
jgi:hypothetical protein